MRLIDGSSWLGVRLLLVASLAAVGCGGDAACRGAKCGGGPGLQPSGGFESDLPNGTVDVHSGAPTPGTGAATGGAQDASSNAGAPPRAASPNPTGSKGEAESSGSDAQRAIVEADMIQIQGDRLYALSRTSGLAVIDISQPDALELLGRFRELPGSPFEMYLRGDVALVMFTGWGQYVKSAADEDAYQYVTTSKVLALDIADPAAIAKLGSFDVPGTISDSRIVGDVMYVVGYQDGYCWSCQENKPRTSIVSLNVADPRAVTEVDQLFYAEDNQSWRRSVTVTDRRMYVAGPEWGQTMPTGSTIQVIDISDPEGDLVEGDAVEVDGQINSRWQMDEYAGVLRVISQPPQWWGPQGQTQLVAPTVQTFRVVSSNQLEPLGRTEIQLPMREALQSVRFDGPRGYAITAERKDPLFTIDLTDPAKPRQVGELVMPGFVWHMEPRGERLLGLGFDQGNPAGSITVSLFDVKDLAAPKMLSRVNFGGDWGSLPEDQDRAHKLFRVLDDAGLIFVPFSGWNDSRILEGGGCKGSAYVGGVQIIDFKDDTLTARGAANGLDQARRALLHRDHLLSVSDERVLSYDISNRDEPKQVSEITLARYVQNAFQLGGGVVARMSYENYTGTPRFDFVRADEAGEPNQSLSQLDLSDLSESGASICDKSLSVQSIFVHGTELDVLYQSWDSRADGTGQGRSGIAVVDVRDASNPRVVSDTHWSNENNWSWYGGYYSYGYYNGGVSAVRTESAIAILEGSWEYSAVSSTQKVRLRVIDLRDPSKVTVSTLPFTAVSSYSGLIADGESVLTGHFIGNNQTGRGRFYVDRFDLSDPRAPKLLAAVNVPGNLLQYDSASNRAITSELERELLSDVTYEECAKRFAYYDFNTGSPNNGSAAVAAPPVRVASGVGGAGADIAPPPSPKGKCTGYHQRLHLVQLTDDVGTLEDTIELDPTQQVTSFSPGDGVAFATLSRGGFYYGGPAIDCVGPCGRGAVANEPAELLVLGGFGQGEFEEGHLTVDNSTDSGRWWGWWGSPPVYATGKLALLISEADVAIIDATTPSEPKITRREPLIAPAQSVDVRDGTALLSLGAQGVQWLSLE